MSTWQDIRILRANPPPLVSPERAGVFASSLERAEQLMKAASNVGHAARPLPLFYALSQAGRAIAAARLADNWRLSGHGLQARGDWPRLLERRSAPLRDARNLARTRTEPWEPRQSRFRHGRRVLWR